MKIILVIDDDADDRSLFMEAVEEITPELICHTAGNGQDGLKQMRDAAMGCPDLIFLDVNMPVMNGWDCLSALKKNLCSGISRSSCIPLRPIMKI